MPKVSIIGTGFVGRTTSFLIAKQNLADIVLIDVLPDIPVGTAIDISQAGYINNYDNAIEGSTDYKDIEGSDIVVISAGSPRKPGMDRDELLKTNGKILKTIVKNIWEYAPKSIIITVTNPVDLINLGAYYLFGERQNKVIGMSSLLDSSRMAYYMAKAAKVPISSTEALVIGAHNNTMVPLIRFSRINDQPIEKILEPIKIAKVIDETRRGGETIVSFLKSGSAYYAPASCICRMVKAIIQDSKETFPVSVVLKGEYGFEGISIGVPARLGKSGLEGIIELKLNKEEKSAFAESAGSIKKRQNLLANVISSSSNLTG